MLTFDPETTAEFYGRPYHGSSVQTLFDVQEPQWAQQSNGLFRVAKNEDCATSAL